MDGGNTIRQPFIEHVYELRRRLLLCSLALLAGGAFGYAIYDLLLELIRRPLNQTLYYTSPVGGFSFVFKICIAFGLIVALPVIIYHFFKFVEPVTHRKTRNTIYVYLFWSVVLAFAGVGFGYLISLPAALHFLTRFGGETIQSLITADEYFNFALAYIAGFALLFQLPLIVLFINRIKPLKPAGMMRAQRYIILVSFIVAALLTPTPDPINQLIMALPIIVLYQLSVAMVWLMHKKNHQEPDQQINKKPLHEPPTSVNKRINKPARVQRQKITDIVNIQPNPSRVIKIKEKKFNEVSPRDPARKLVDILVS